MTIVNAMTVDVEDYFQVSAFESHISRDDWDKLPHRVEQNTNKVLDLFEKANVNATFFLLGWVAERYPQLVRRIADEGHEIASHGYSHIRVHNQSRAEFRDDVAKTKRLLEDLSGCEVKGYRAASFSIDARNLWAHEELEAAGYRYSSSIYPIRHDIYGMPEGSRVPYFPTGTGFQEIPMSTLKLFGRLWPCSGGGYFRLFPYPLSKMAIKRLNEKEGMPCIFYLHPWELDPHQPRQQNVGLKTNFRHYVSLQKMQGRLSRLLGDFQWDRLDTHLG